MKKYSRIQGNILQCDYDRVLTLSDAECCFSLTQQEVAMLLSQTDYFAWSTRWFSNEDTPIDQDVIDTLKDNLEYKLMSGCCPDDNLNRYLPDGTYQISTDGGITWVDAPTEDPRYGAPQAPPLSGSDGDAKRCAAADNVEAQYLVMRDNTIALLTAGTTVLEIVAGLIGLIGFILGISIVGVTFGVILFSLAGFLLTLTPESVADQIDTEALDQFRCLLYCRMDSAGRISATGLANLLSDIHDGFDDFPELFFYSITASLGVTGLNNAATLGLATADDCGDCDCAIDCGTEAQITTGTLVTTYIEDGRTVMRIASGNVVFGGGDFQAVVLGIYGGGVGVYPCCHIFAVTVFSGAVHSSGYTNCAGSVVDPGNPETHDVIHLDYVTAPGDGTPFVVNIVFGT